MTTIDTGTYADTTEEFAVRMVEAIDSASLAILLSSHLLGDWPSPDVLLSSSPDALTRRTSPVSIQSSSRSHVARKARTWKGARTPSALKRVRQALRRSAVNRSTRSEAKTLVGRATSIALGRSTGDAPEAVSAALSALDKANRSDNRPIRTPPTAKPTMASV